MRPVQGRADQGSRRSPGWCSTVRRQRAGGEGHGQADPRERGRRAGPANAVAPRPASCCSRPARKSWWSPGAMVGVHSASVAGGNETMDTLGVTTLMARRSRLLRRARAITGRMVTTRPGQMAWLTRTSSSSMGARVADQRAAPAAAPDRAGFAGRHAVGLDQGIRIRPHARAGRKLLAAAGHRRSG